MWAFNAYETASRPPKTFDVEDFLGSLFRPQDAFVHAASLNQLEVVRRWISKNHDVNLTDKEGHLALCAAAQNRCMDVMLLLLESGVNVDEQQTDGKTALHVACTWGRFDAATLLLQRGARATLRDQEGQVPLHAACKNGHDRIVQLLLETAMDPFVADELGATPFDLARDWQRLEITQILNGYHQTRFAPSMRARVRFVMKNIRPQTPALPSSMQQLVASFLC